MSQDSCPRDPIQKASEGVNNRVMWDTRYLFAGFLKSVKEKAMPPYEMEGILSLGIKHL